MVTEGQEEHAEQMLVQNQYFGYKGIICIAQVK
jgi:hypothetical protein